MSDAWCQTLNCQWEKKNICETKPINLPLFYTNLINIYRRMDLKGTVSLWYAIS